jgi:hypothetical protein
MLESGSEGDQIVLKALSYYMGLQITVVDVSDLTEKRIRHDKPLKEADICLVYNGTNHYSPAGKSRLTCPNKLTSARTDLYMPERTIM